MMRHPKYSTEWWLFEAKVRVLPTGEWVPGTYRKPSRFTWWHTKRALRAALRWPAQTIRGFYTRRAVAELQKQMEAARPFLEANDLLPERTTWSTASARREKLRRASARLSGMYRDGLVAA